ncbi:MAG: phosphoribosylanthranilate isomerase [Proteobacteria bacterium]|nr:phosphoribosylanthranilate isomerase [Pseudomonadota bacterium]
MRRIKIKLCGFTEKNSIESAIEAECDFIGFVFYEKSPRFVTIEAATALAKKIPEKISKVAVLVDPDFEFLDQIAKNLSPDFFQFHGTENINFLREVRKKFPHIKIIKAFKINDLKGLELIKSFEDVADIFLFDGQNPGSGKSFKWEILKNFHSKKDWFLSGGLRIDNLDEALKITGATMIDISSGIEKSRGQKSPELIRELATKIKNIS